MLLPKPALLWLAVGGRKVGTLTVYLLYEHHKNESGEILATDMLLTSVFPGPPGVHFWNPIEKVLFNFIKEAVFKQVHTKFRTIDMDTYIWSFFPPYGKQVFDAVKNSPLNKANVVQFERVEDLVGQKASGSIKRPAANKIDPKDFFYQTEASASPSGPTKEQIREKLAKMLMVPETQLDNSSLRNLKQAYRVAAMTWHPDRNNGDGTQMSELNYLWQAWQPYATPEGS